MLNLDTHIVFGILNGELTPREKNLLAKRQWSISAIVLWELAKLEQIGRIELDLYSEQFKEVLRQIHIWPLTWEICQTVKSLDFKSDPANELIAATSVVHKVPLLTRDRKIAKSHLVPLA